MSFTDAIRYVLRNEGGYVNNPSDPGGITNYGITAKLYSEFIGRPMDDYAMRLLTRADAEQFYYTRFWRHYGLNDIISPAIATAVLDVMVNLGPVYAARFSQEICKIPVDGLWGPKTIEAVNLLPKELFVENLVELVEARYRYLIDHNSDLKQFAHGWDKRAERLMELIT